MVQGNDSQADPGSGPFHRRPVGRRDFLYVGVVGGIGLALDHLFRPPGALGAPKFYESKEGSAKSVIHIFLPGGMAAQESFDPKPYAPIEYRGDLGVISSKVDGVVFSDLFRKTADVADKITVVRSMSHGEAAHERGIHNMFTGYRPSPALVFPSIGSVVAHELGNRKNLPAYVCVPDLPTTYAGSGYLSSAYAPFCLGSDPAASGFTVRDLNPSPGVGEPRSVRRRTLLEAVNEYFRAKEKSDDIDAMDTFYQQAYSLMSSKSAREAFNIDAEPAALRDQYGRNAAGQRFLLARRLVEAGVRFVSVSYGSWDMHTKIRDAMRGQAPPLDQALAALIRDLDSRGLLDSTLVMVTSEFGRTPKINPNGGRDHWPKVFSILMAGGGLKRGFVYGASNANSTAVAADPLSVEDWAATVYHQIGIVADKELVSPGDRPVEIVKNGNVATDLIS
jgi:hypothetical protein